MNQRTYKIVQGLLFLLTVAVLSASFYFQYIKGLEPCPLCLMQRICVFFLALFGLLGLASARWRLAAVLQLFSAVCGLFFAGRQLWLQSLTAEHIPACMPGLDVLIHYFPWQDVARALFWGSGECAEVAWQWLGLTMPAWAALYFFIMFLGSAVIAWLLNRK